MFWRKAETCLGSGGLVLFMGSWLLGFWFSINMPKLADVQAGYLIPSIIHGTVVYLNDFSYWLQTILFWGGLILAFLALVIDIRINPFDRREWR